MAPSRAPSSALLRSLRALTIEPTPIQPAVRSLSSTALQHADAQAQKPTKESYYQNPQPETAYLPRLERRLSRAGTQPVGSRRRRMALATSPNIPFDQMPYQCFQEARKILIADREEKLQKIAKLHYNILRLQQADGNEIHRGGEAYKQRRITSMKAELERLKILADINDPNVKRRFEDGKGDMSKPIYRFLANRKWRSYRHKILVQRITQLRVVPDVVPECNPTIAPTIRFDRSTIIGPGNFVPSTTSLSPPRLHLQSFDKGAKLVTIAIVDPDVPNLDTDSFDSRCHFLAANIEISPTSPNVNIADLAADKIVLPYLPPWAQKGAPYHRLSIVVLQQKDNTPVDVALARRQVPETNRLGFKLRVLMSRFLLQPLTATLWRTKWDEGMREVMLQLGVPGADEELKRTKVEPLPYTRRDTRRMRG